MTAMIAPTQVPFEIVRFDNLAMIVASILPVVFAYTGRHLSRLEGLLMVAFYVGYVAWLWPSGVTAL